MDGGGALPSSKKINAVEYFAKKNDRLLCRLVGNFEVPWDRGKRGKKNANLIYEQRVTFNYSYTMTF